MEKIVSNVAGESVAALQDGINQPLIAVNKDVRGNLVAVDDAFDESLETI